MFEPVRVSGVENRRKTKGYMGLNLIVQAIID